MPRYRVTVDLKTLDDVVLTDQQMRVLAEDTSTLMQTAGLANVKDVKANLRVEPVAYVHQHESTREHSCDFCVRTAKDRQNSSTGDPE